MQSLSRPAVAAARNARTTIARQTRRYAHDDHGHHAHNVKESFGKGFFLPLAAIPVGYVLYQVTRDKDNSFLTNLFAKYHEKHEELRRRNALHMTMKEQAGQDRFLFLHTHSEPIVEMKFPEIMNNGAPYNVVAGSQVNMDKVIAKYQAEANLDNEMKLERMRNNEVPCEQPMERVLGVRRHRGVEIDPNGPGGVNYEAKRLNAAIR